MTSKVSKQVKFLLYFVLYAFQTSDKVKNKKKYLIT